MAANHPVARATALACLFGGTLVAQGQDPDTEYLVVETAETGMDLSNFVHLTEVVTNKLVLFADGGEARAEGQLVRLANPVRLRVADFLDFARIQLYLLGLRTELRHEGEVVEMIPFGEKEQPAFDRSARFVPVSDLDEPRDKSEKDIVTPVHLAQLPCAEAIEALRPVVLGTRHPESEASLELGRAASSLLLLRGSRAQVRDAHRVLQHLDVEPNEHPNEVRLIALEKAEPGDVAAKLEQDQEKLAETSVIVLESARAVAVIGNKDAVGTAATAIRRHYDVERKNDP